MLESNRCTKIQADQVKTYVERHGDFTSSNNLKMVQKGFEKLGGYL